MPTINPTFTVLFADGVQKQVDAAPLVERMKEILVCARNPNTVEQAYGANGALMIREALTSLFNKTEEEQVNHYISGFQRYCEEDGGAMIFDDDGTPTENALKLFYIVEWEALQEAANEAA